MPRYLQAYQHVYVAMSITTTKAASASQKLTSSAGFASVNVRPHALMPQACAPPLLQLYMPSGDKSCDMTQACACALSPALWLDWLT